MEHYDMVWYGMEQISSGTARYCYCYLRSFRAATATVTVSPPRVSFPPPLLFDVTPLLVLVLATTLAKSWTNCVTLELEQQRYLRTRFGAVSLIVFSMTSTHTVHHTLFALSPFSHAQPLCSAFVYLN